MGEQSQKGVDSLRANCLTRGASFFPPCRSICGVGGGHPPGGRAELRSERRNVVRLRRLRLHILGCPTTRLVLRGLAVMARLTQRPQVLWCIRVRLLPCLQLLSTQRPMVGNGCRSTAQHTPRIRVQVSLALTLPANVITALTRVASLLFALCLVRRAWTTIGQLTAPRLTAWRSRLPWHTRTPGVGTYGFPEVGVSVIARNRSASLSP